MPYRTLPICGLFKPAEAACTLQLHFVAIGWTKITPFAKPANGLARSSMTAELLNARGQICRPALINQRKVSFIRAQVRLCCICYANSITFQQSVTHVNLQTWSRRGPIARCDTYNPISSQRASSSQGTSCSGQEWSSNVNEEAAQNSLTCHAKLQESDLQLPKTDGSGNGGTGDLGGNGSSGGGGGDEGSSGDGENDDERLLSTAEVCG